ncbi:16S rRNA processing protein RimM [bacterium]|nr:16S rRNA processing protein RimM [bacterium]
MPLVRVGSIRRPHGVKGQLKCDYRTDHPEWLDQRSHYLIYDHRSGEVLQLTLASIEHYRDCFLASFNEVTSPEDGQRFNGWDIMYWVARGALPREEGEVYFFELEGMEVRTSKGDLVGKVVDVAETGAGMFLEVQGEKLILIPFNMEHVPELYLEEGYLVSDYSLLSRDNNQ